MRNLRVAILVDVSHVAPLACTGWVSGGSSSPSSVKAPICWRYSYVRCASSSSMRAIAKPTWTSTKSPGCTSGVKARLIVLRTPQKSTLADRNAGSSPSMFSTLPGTARHIEKTESFPAFDHRVLLCAGGLCNLPPKPAGGQEDGRKLEHITLLRE